MSESALTPDQILAAAEEVLRRFGPTKASVVDVARALGVSHGSVYRHFASKAALRAAGTERWLARISVPWLRSRRRPARPLNVCGAGSTSWPRPNRVARWRTPNGLPLT